MLLPDKTIPIQRIVTGFPVELFIKREDEVHREISGNKYWKLFFNINNYLDKNVKNPLLITFGGAFSNHIAATAALGKDIKIPTLGIIRGEELSSKWQENPTLLKASKDGMTFHFVSREAYRDKEKLTEHLQKQFHEALIIPEGGTNENAVKGVKYMLDERTKEFDYLCVASGTGGTLAGFSKYAEERQRVLGFFVVNDSSLAKKVKSLSGKENFELIDATFGGYGKIPDEIVRFINTFYQNHGVPLDPVYTGKMMMKLFELLEKGFFPKGSRILAMHTGGLQGIEGANEFLKLKQRPLINFSQ